MSKEFLQTQPRNKNNTYMIPEDNPKCNSDSNNTNCTDSSASIDIIPQKDLLLNERSMKKDCSLIGRDAARAQLDMFLADEKLQNFMLKKNNVIPFLGVYQGNGDFDIISLENPKDDFGEDAKNERGNKIWEQTDELNDGLYYIDKNPADWFIIPAVMDVGLEAGNCLGSFVIPFETDDATIEQQWENLERLYQATGIKPALVIFSGGKSLHVYFWLTELVTPEVYQRLKRKAIVCFSSDTAIQNHNREMRFAGSLRQSKGTYQEVQYHHPENRVTPVALEQALDTFGKLTHGLSDERWKKYNSARFIKSSKEIIAEIIATPEDLLNPQRQTVKKISAENRNINREKISELSTDECPLEIFLGKDKRELFDSGISEGGRNNGIFSMASGLLTHAAALDDLGIEHTDAYDLIVEFNDRCSPPLDDSEFTQVWDSANSRSNYASTLDDEYYLRKYRRWCKEEGIDTVADGFSDAAVAAAALALEITKENEETDPEIRHRKKCRRIAKTVLTRTPDITQDKTTGYFPELEIKDIPKGIIALAGGCGSGKTHTITKIIEKLKTTLSLESKILQIGHLNSLLKNTSKKFGLMHHQEAKALKLPLDSVPEMAVTDISMALMLDVINMKPVAILILDEIAQILPNIVCGSTIKGTLRMRAWAKFCHLIRTANYIILSDADISDFYLDLIETIRGDDKKAFLMQHTGSPENSKGDFYLTSNKGLFLDQLDIAIKNNEKVIVPCESKADLLVLETKYKDSDFITFHSDNSHLTEVQAKIETIDKTYLEHKSMGYTKTLGTGVDLSTIHYDKRFSFFTGSVFPASDQKQIMSRYRPVVDELCYIPDFVRYKEMDYKNIYAELITKITDNKNFSNNIENLIDEGFLPAPEGKLTTDQQHFLKAYSWLLARRNASLNNPKECFIDELTRAGYNVIDIDGVDEKTDDQKATELSHKTSKAELKELDDIAIASAPTLTDLEAKTLKQKQGSQTLAERRQLSKHYLQKTLGIEITQEIVKLDRTKHLCKSIKNLHLLFTTDELADALEAKDIRYNPATTDRDYPAARRALLQNIGISLLIQKLQETDYKYTNDTPEVKTLATTIRANAEALKRYNIITVRFTKDDQDNFKQSDTELVNSLLAYLAVFTKGKTIDKVVTPPSLLPYIEKPVGGVTKQKSSKTKSEKGTQAKTNKKTREQIREYSLDLGHWSLVETVLAHMGQKAMTLDDFKKKVTDETPEEKDNGFIIEDHDDFLDVALTAFANYEPTELDLEIEKYNERVLENEQKYGHKLSELINNNKKTLEDYYIIGKTSKH